MATDEQNWRDWAVPPGEILLEVLDERQMSQSELARRMGRPVKTINEIIHAKAALTTDTAIQLELALGLNAGLWNTLETNYRAHLSWVRSCKELEAEKTWVEAFPVNDLVKVGLIERPRGVADKTATLLRFFGVSSTEAWESQWTEVAAAFRTSPSHASSFPAVAAWLRWGELLAGEHETPPFDASAFRKALDKIKTLTRQDPGAAIQQAKELGREAGVVVVVTPEFTKTSLSGAARRLSGGQALIQLSARHKSDDQLWFSFFHEAGHLLEDPRIDRVDPADLADRVNDDAEVAADRFARDVLINLTDYKAFVASGDFSAGSVRALAKAQGVSPGIVVGRLQRDDHLAWSQLNNLKKKVRLG